VKRRNSELVQKNDEGIIVGRLNQSSAMGSSVIQEGFGRYSGVWRIPAELGCAAAASSMRHSGIAGKAEALG
jgi:hypothetical protein